MWVVLMAPVSAFAAVVAMAAPQRLAAESSMQEAADDLAVFAVVWRDGRGTSEGPLDAFPPDCEQDSAQEQSELDELEGELQDLVDEGRSEDDPDVIDKRRELDGARRALEDIDKRKEVCRFLFEALAEDLGRLGVDSGALSGFYSDSLNESDKNSEEGFEVPCTVAGGAVVRDAVHVALAARWQDGGWAASQAWPEGLPMAAESMGLLSLPDSFEGAAPLCDRQLVMFDTEGRPVWASGDPDPPSRALSQSVGRTPLTD